MVSSFYKDKNYLSYLVIDNFDFLNYFSLKCPAPCEFLKVQRLIAVNDNNNNKNLAQFSNPPYPVSQTGFLAGDCRNKFPGESILFWS